MSEHGATAGEASTTTADASTAAPAAPASTTTFAPPVAIEAAKPATPAEYAFDFTPEQQPYIATLGQDRLNAFREAAHANGFTQQQASFAIASFLEAMPDMGVGGQRFDAESATAELRKEWSSDEVFHAELDRARTALKTYGREDAQSLADDYGNDPRMVRMLSRMEKAMSTKSAAAPVPRDGIGAAEYVQKNWEAYSNPRHVEHARVTQQYQQRLRAELGSRADEAAYQ